MEGGCGRGDRGMKGGGGRKELSLFILIVYLLSLRLHIIITVVRAPPALHSLATYM